MARDSSSTAVAEGDERGVGPSESARGASGAIQVRTSLTRPSTTVISLSGAHDLSTAPALEQCAAGHLARCDRLVVDLSHVSFVDSSIVNALVRLARQSRPRGVTFHVAAVDGSHPHRVLALMGLLGHLGVVEALPELQAAGASQPRDAQEPH